VVYANSNKKKLSLSNLACQICLCDAMSGEHGKHIRHFGTTDPIRPDVSCQLEGSVWISKLRAHALMVRRRSDGEFLVEIS